MRMRVTMTAAVVAVLCATTDLSRAAVSYAGGTYTQDFDTLAVGPTGNTNPWVDNVTLLGWHALDGAIPTVTYEAQQGGDAHHYLTSAGTNGSTDRALGAMSWSPQHSWGLCLTNTTGAALASFTLEYTGEEWRDQGTQNIIFAFSTDATSLQGGTWMGVPALDFVPPHKANLITLDGNDPANRVTYSETVTVPGGWTDGSDLWLRWVMGPSNGALLAIDDLSFSGPMIPEPASAAILALGLAAICRRRRHLGR